MRRSIYETPSIFFGIVLLGYVALSFIVGIGPALEAQSRYEPLPGSSPPTPPEARGLEVYVAEGCPYCHTQQVRPLEVDSVWGRPTAAADYARLRPLSWWMNTPAVLGSERTGPDLTNIGKRQSSEAWQLMHLYDPRSVTPWSIMPRFHGLFRIVDSAPPGATVVPVPPKFAPGRAKVVATQRALDLVAYVLSREQAPLPGAETSSPPEAAPSAAPAPAAGGGAASRGAQLYAANCAACHQAGGAGIPATFPPLKGDPVVNAADPTMHISTVLHGSQGRTIGGVKYPVTMPPFGGQLNDEEIAAIINHERTSWGNGAKQIEPAAVARVRQEGVEQ